MHTALPAIPRVDLPGLGPCARLVLGTMALSPKRQEQAFALLDAYAEAGGNCLDTALVYGGGDSERVIGQWLRSRGCRDQMLIVDKGCHHDAAGPRVRPDALDADLAENLRRLGVDAIDLYMLHRDDPAVPVGPILSALEGHRRAGRIRAYGASNWTPARLDEAAAFAQGHGLAGFVASSPNLSLAEPAEPRWPGCVSVGAQDRAWYESRRMPLLPWSSQASGFFTGRFRPDGPADPEMVRVYFTAANWERLRRAETLAAERGATANQVALAYVLHQPFPTFPLIGPLSVEELRSSLQAMDIALPPAEVEWLDLRRPER